MEIKGRAAYVNPKTVTGQIEYDKETKGFVIRLDDSNNLDFWMEIKIPPEEIAKCFKQ
jgi:hypothetical protein